MLFWSQHNDGDIRGAIAQYNAYMQVLDDLENGLLEIEDVNGKELAEDIKRKARADFRKKRMPTIDTNNDYHKAMYVHIVKSYLENLKNGVFLGHGGHSSTRPEVAAAIEDRVSEIYQLKMTNQG